MIDVLIINAFRSIFLNMAHWPFPVIIIYIYIMFSHIPDFMNLVHMSLLDSFLELFCITFILQDVFAYNVNVVKLLEWFYSHENGGSWPPATANILFCPIGCL